MRLKWGSGKGSALGGKKGRGFEAGSGRGEEVEIRKFLVEKAFAGVGVAPIGADDSAVSVDERRGARVIERDGNLEVLIAKSETDSFEDGLFDLLGRSEKDDDTNLIDPVIDGCADDSFDDL